LQERAESLTFTGRLRSVRFALRGIAVLLRSQHSSAGAVAIGLLVLAPRLLARL